MENNRKSWPAPTSREREALDDVLCGVIDGMANTIGELTEEDERIREAGGVVDGWLQRVNKATADSDSLILISERATPRSCLYL